MKKLRNIRGEFLLGILGLHIIAGAIIGITGLATYKTAKNGVLKKNGQVIWCKMQGKGNDVCDAKYGHLGNGQY